MQPAPRQCDYCPAAKPDRVIVYVDASDPNHPVVIPKEVHVCRGQHVFWTTLDGDIDRIEFKDGRIQSSHPAQCEHTTAKDKGLCRFFPKGEDADGKYEYILYFVPTGTTTPVKADPFVIIEH